MKKKEIAKNAKLNFDEIKDLLSFESLKTLVDDRNSLFIVGGMQDSICTKEPAQDSNCTITPSLDSSCYIIDLPAQDNICN